MKIIYAIELEEQDFIEGNKHGKLNGWNNPVNAAMYNRGMLRSVMKSLNEERSALRDAIEIISPLQDDYVRDTWDDCSYCAAELKKDDTIDHKPDCLTLKACEWIKQQNDRGVNIDEKLEPSDLFVAKGIIRRLLLYMNEEDYVGGLPVYNEAKKFLGLE